MQLSSKIYTSSLLEICPACIVVIHQVNMLEVKCVKLFHIALVTLMSPRAPGKLLNKKLNPLLLMKYKLET